MVFISLVLFVQVLAAGANPSDPDPALVERARGLLARAPLIDTHNDLPSMLVEKYGGDLSQVDLGKARTDLCADVPRLRQGKVGAQYWSVFVESSTAATHTSLHDALREFDVVLRLVASQPAFELARTADDIERIHRSGRIASLIGVEGGHIIEDSPAALRILFQLGARYLTLTHWQNVAWADAATALPEHHGLTRYGERLVHEMNRLGMFVDLSHVSADTMRDVLRVTRAPVLFSHSNAFAVASHVRNVPDDVLRLLHANGGVIHVNFIRDFVTPGAAAREEQLRKAVREIRTRVTSEEALNKALADWKRANPYPGGSVSAVADQIDHIRKVAGVDHIGIGGDFYDAGNPSMVAGLEDVTRYPFLFAELLRRGYSDEDVLKIAGRNHLRAMRQMEQVAAQLQRSAPVLTAEGPAALLQPVP